MGQATQILRQSSHGDEASTAELAGMVYDRLKELAGYYLRQERPNHTLQPTEIVHEAYLSLVDQDQVGWQDRTHFIAIAASAMRRVLVAHARRRGAQKRGGDWHRVPLDDRLSLAGAADVDLASLDEALSKFEQLDERAARVVELRFFGGLTTEEVAHDLGVSTRTVEGDWFSARAWLHRMLAEE